MIKFYSFFENFLETNKNWVPLGPKMVEFLALACSIKFLGTTCQNFAPQSRNAVTQGQYCSAKLGKCESLPSP